MTPAATSSRELLTAAGQTVVGHAIVRDEPAQVVAVIRERLARPDHQVFILTGGTGIHLARLHLRGRRVPPEQAHHRVRRALPHALLSGGGRGRHDVARQAGVVQGRLVFSLPGSPHACRLALEKLIIPEMGHLLREVNR
jgi:molybdenum cofactor biosynthesis protein B